MGGACISCSSLMSRSCRHISAISAYVRLFMAFLNSSRVRGCLDMDRFICSFTTLTTLLEAEQKQVRINSCNVKGISAGSHQCTHMKLKPRVHPHICVPINHGFGSLTFQFIQLVISCDAYHESNFSKNLLV